jgi:hypothetical protein
MQARSQSQAIEKKEVKIALELAGVSGECECVSADTGPHQNKSS